jgi:hypothetical protein
MVNQIFDSFERTEFSDEIFAIFGRVLTVATRFDASTRTLEMLLSFKKEVSDKNDTLDNDEYQEMLLKLRKKYKSLDQAIKFLPFNENIKKKLHRAKKSRNELIHEATFGATNGFDHMDSEELSQHLDYIEKLVLKVIRCEAMISTIISIENKDPISCYLFSKEYEDKYVSWVMERFEE